MLSAAVLGAQTPPAQKQAAPPAQKQAGAQDTTSAIADRGARSQLSIVRETFTYNDGGRRDPMISLAGTSDIRPLINELRLVSVFYDESGMRSNALLFNTADKKTMYRVRVGQMVGRMTVTQITRTDVVFTIDEYGLNRQERLSIKPDSTGAKTP